MLVRLVVAVLLLVATTSCGSETQPKATREAEGISALGPFDQMAIAQIKRLEKLTVWRVGPAATGPGRTPDTSLKSVAVNNGSGWAISIEGDGQLDKSGNGLPADASPREAQELLVEWVELATGRKVEATWTETDADTWVAAASFEE